MRTISIPVLFLAAASMTLACTSGSPGTPPGGGGADTSLSVLTRNKHETRDGFFTQPALTKTTATTMAQDPTFSAKFAAGGEYWGSPLYIDKGPGGKGAFVAATSDNNVYTFDGTTGSTIWTHSIGPAPTMSGAGCGNVAPTGITSTPVIDATTRTIYVAGGIGDTTGILRHEVHALDVDTGAERAGWPVNVSALTGPGNVAFNTKPQNQRGALSLVNGTLYIPYGGHGGDCGNYRGWVVAINTAMPSQTGAWVTGGQGEAIWAAGGMASDGNGIIAVTGNSTIGTTTHFDSEEAVRVTGLGQVDRAKGIFFPGTWHAMDASDADFGSSSPVAITLPGATPSSLVAAVTKNGHFYLLAAANLGGMDGQLADLTIAPGETAMSIHAALAAYTSTTGLHVVLNASNTDTVCPASSTGHGMISVLVSPGPKPTAKVAWCAAGGSASPIATSTDGKNDTIVWYYDGGLVGVDGDTGATIASAAGCPPVRQFTSPIAVNGRIVVGGDAGLCAWSVAKGRSDGGDR